MKGHVLSYYLLFEFSYLLCYQILFHESLQTDLIYFSPFCWSLSVILLLNTSLLILFFCLQVVCYLPLTTLLIIPHSRIYLRAINHALGYVLDFIINYKTIVCAINASAHHQIDLADLALDDLNYDFLLISSFPIRFFIIPVSISYTCTASVELN